MTESQIVAKNLSDWMNATPALDTLQKVALKSGAGFGTVRRMKNGVGNPTRESLSKVARAFGRTADDLLRPSGDESNGRPNPDTDRYIAIPHLPSTAAAAAGGIDSISSIPRIPVRFSREWLNQKGLMADSLAIFTAKGDSMSPFINEGDQVLIDTGADNLIPDNPDEVWVIEQEHPPRQRVKRLLYRENGDLIIRSDNLDKSRFPDEFVPADGETVHMLGRVVWRGG